MRVHHTKELREGYSEIVLRFKSETPLPLDDVLAEHGRIEKKLCDRLQETSASFGKTVVADEKKIRQRIVKLACYFKSQGEEDYIDLARKQVEMELVGNAAKLEVKVHISVEEYGMIGKELIVLARYDLDSAESYGNYVNALFEISRDDPDEYYRMLIYNRRTDGVQKVLQSRFGYLSGKQFDAFKKPCSATFIYGFLTGDKNIVDEISDACESLSESSTPRSSDVASVSSYGV